MGIRNNLNHLTTLQTNEKRATATLLSAAMLSALSLVAGCNQAPKAADGEVAAAASADAENPVASTPATTLGATDSASVAASTEPVTIYSSRNEQLIQPLLDQFTKETGTPVELVTDDSGPLIARF